ncbi:MAG TPA: class II aldolase [Desulfotomaculum sp.]|jgi:L-fuculose-phosphate aldolase|nr:class II aldolase [Desulfotomaculum sp.]HCJ79825.1 class II aldolase [Desulfotomaculum sp.]
MTIAAEKAKEQVLKISLRMVENALVTSKWGNFSVRIPQEKLIVITPRILPYGTLQIRDIVVLDMEGQIVEGVRPPSNEFCLHQAIYKARDDVNAVMHTHSIFASALAVARKPIPPILEDLARYVGGEVPVAPYARAGTPELAKAAVETLAQNNAVLLANHGLVGVGRTTLEALIVCQLVEKAAKVFLLADLIAHPVVLAGEDVNFLRQDYLSKYGIEDLRECLGGVLRHK